MSNEFVGLYLLLHSNVYKWPKIALIFSSLLFYSAAPTCFDTCVLSSGSCSVPAELHENRMEWLIKTLRYTLLRACYVEAWHAPMGYLELTFLWSF
jgi:hypothetical protein